MNACAIGRLAAVFTILGLSAAWTALAGACGMAYPVNQPVQIASESAIILWDAATKTEHFIRRAEFSTEAKDFGFLVPTPALPELFEASDSAFKELAEITKPREEKKPRPAGGGCGIGCSKHDPDLPGGRAAPGGVEVLAEKRVGAFDTKTLKATDADALEAWLQKNEYPFTKELKTWIKPYVDEGWVVTAFKFTKEAANKPELAAVPVRMTFKTERPVFPYREPEDQTPPHSTGKTTNRLLRVYFLSTGRMEGTFGKTDKLWPAHTVWANKIDTAAREKILTLLKMPANTGPASWWLTEFEDRSSPRPGKEDVYFALSINPELPVERPPHIIYTAASRPDAMWVALALCFVVPPLVRWWRKRPTGPMAS